jgi:fibronectin-binding autotransporter adhesin
LTVSSGNLVVSSGDLTLTLGDLAVTSGSTTLGNGLTVSSGNLVVSSGDLTLTLGDLAVTSGSTTLGNGLTVSSGNLVVSSGDLTLTLGDLAVTSGSTTLGNGLTVSSGNLAVTSGSTTLGNGLTVSSGNLAVTSGSTTLGNGLTVSSGNLAVTSGSTTLGSDLTVSGTTTVSSITGPNSLSTDEISLFTYNGGEPYLKFRSGANPTGIALTSSDTDLFFMQHSTSENAITIDYNSGALSLLSDPDTAYTNIFKLFSDGTMYIGNTSESTTDFRIVSSTTGAGSILFNDGSSSGYMIYDHSTNSFVIATNGSSAFSINAAQNCAVLGNAFTIGSTSLANDPTLLFQCADNASREFYIKFQDSSGIQATFRMGANSSSVADTLAFFIGSGLSGGEVAFIANLNQFAIGNTSNTSETLVMRSSTTATIGFNDGATSGSLVYSHSTNGLTVTTNSVSAVVIDSSQNMTVTGGIFADNLVSVAYTPTVTAGTNMSTASLVAARYMRVGEHYHVTVLVTFTSSGGFVGANVFTVHVTLPATTSNSTATKAIGTATIYLEPSVGDPVVYGSGYIFKKDTDEITIRVSNSGVATSTSELYIAATFMYIDD